MSAAILFPFRKPCDLASHDLATTGPKHTWEDCHRLPEDLYPGGRVVGPGRRYAFLICFVSTPLYIYAVCHAMGLAALRTATLRCAGRATPEMGCPPDVEGPLGLAALHTFMSDQRWVGAWTSSHTGDGQPPGCAEGGPMGLTTLRTPHCVQHAGDGSPPVRGRTDGPSCPTDGWPPGPLATPEMGSPPDVRGVDQWACLPGGPRHRVFPRRRTGMTRSLLNL